MTRVAPATGALKIGSPQSIWRTILPSAASTT